MIKPKTLSDFLLSSRVIRSMVMLLHHTHMLGIFPPASSFSMVFVLDKGLDRRHGCSFSPPPTSLTWSLRESQDWEEWAPLSARMSWFQVSTCWTFSELTFWLCSSFSPPSRIYTSDVGSEWWALVLHHQEFPLDDGGSGWWANALYTPECTIF